MKLRKLLARPLIFSVLVGSMFTGIWGAAVYQTAQTQRPTSTPYAGDVSIFEKPGRDERLQVQRVMDVLGIKTGSAVADIGAGSGWFSVRAAVRVGSTGTVYAEDINPDAVKYIQNRVQKERLSNVKTVLGTPDDPKLPPDSVDAVLFLKVYHEVARPVELMARLKPSLRPGAKIGIIDRKGNGTDHGVNSDVVEREMAEAGFKLLSSYDFTKPDDEDYFLVFAAR
jgi:predicted methyltransferase